MFKSIILFFVFLFSFSAFAEIKLNPTLDGNATVRFEKYLNLAKKAEKVVNSAEFKSRIIAKKFTYTKASGQQVWDKMEAGAELLLPAKNGVWDWKVGFYTKTDSKVIGWTNGGIITVWVNTKYFDKNSDGAIIANIVHEYLHKIGYDHASAKDHNSPPYWIGYLAEELYNDSLKEVNLPPIEVIAEPVKQPVKKLSLWSKIKSWFR